MNPEPIWQEQDLKKALGLSDNLTGQTEIYGIDIDSRRVSAGSLFVPLTPPVASRDGHAFIPAAFAQGASATLSSKISSDSRKVFQVSDTYAALVQLAKAARARVSESSKMIAVTGSSGKTTLKTWLQHILCGVGRTHGSEGSFNNHLGVPLSLARMPAKTQFGLFEVGTNHPGEIAPLSQMIQPDIALVLNVLPVHIGHFNTLEALKAEKLSIAAGLSLTDTLIVEAGLATAVDKPVTTFSIQDFDTSKQHGELSEQGLILYSGSVSVNGEWYSLSLPAPGAHLLATAAACLAVTQVLNIDSKDVIEALRTAPLPAGRGHRVEKSGITIIDDSYNANPESIRFSLQSLKTEPARRRHVILGEMHELGAYGVAAHDSVLAAALEFDSVVAVGEGFRAAAEKYQVPYVESAADIDLEAYSLGLASGDRVLVKGSNRVFWTQGFVDQLVKRIPAP